MKNCKKILTLILAALLLASSMSLSAFAATDPNAETVVIEDADMRQTYTAYRIYQYDAFCNDNGAKIPGGIYIPDNDKIAALLNAADSPYEALKAEDLSDSTKYDTTNYNAGVTYYTRKDSSEDDEELQTWIRENLIPVATVNQSGVRDMTKGTLTFSDLPVGAWVTVPYTTLIHQTPAKQGKDTKIGSETKSVITLPDKRSQGSITIDSPTIGETYTLYRLFDASYSTPLENGAVVSDIPVAYTTSDPAMIKFLKAHTGPTEKQYDADGNLIYEDDGVNPKLADYCPFQLIGDTPNANGQYGIKVKDGFATQTDTLQKFVEMLEKYDKEQTDDNDKVLKNGISQECGEDDITLVFNNLPFGYYVVLPNEGTLVSVDTNAPDVIMRDKNPTNPGKPVKDTLSVQVNPGDVVPYTIYFQASNYNTTGTDITTRKMITKYQLSETYDNLEFKDIVSVGYYTDYEMAVDDTTKLPTYTIGTNAEFTELERFVASTEEGKKGTGDWYHDEEDKKLIIQWAEIDTVPTVHNGVTENVTRFVSKYPDPVLVAVTYNMVVTDEIYEVMTGSSTSGTNLEAKNTVTLDFHAEPDPEDTENKGDEPDDEETSWTEVGRDNEYVYTTGISIRKVAAEDQNKLLEDAMFILYREVGESNSKEYWHRMTDEEIIAAAVEASKEENLEYYNAVKAHDDAVKHNENEEEKFKANNNYKPDFKVVPKLPETVPAGFPADFDDFDPDNATTTLKTTDYSTAAALPDVFVKNDDGKYINVSRVSVSWVDSIEDATEIEADNSYDTVEFDNIGTGTFYLLETEAPDGYQATGTPYTIRVTMKDSADNTFVGEDDTEVIKRTDDHISYTITLGNSNDNTASPNGGDYGTEIIANSKGATLPTTGGAGTVALIAIGSLVFGATAVVLVTKKRLYNEE